MIIDGRWEPSESEIRQQCRAIQERWSPAERVRRAAWMFEQEQYRIPTVRDEHRYAERLEGEL